MYSMCAPARRCRWPEAWRRVAVLLALALTAGVILLAPPARATHPGRNGMIVFTELPSGQPGWSLEGVEPDGSNRRTLVGKPVRRPAWSPDGGRIAYDLKDAQATRIYVAAADGSNERYVTEGEGPSWSPDGTKLVFKAPDCTLWIRDLGTNVQTQLTHLDAGAAVECHSEPDWQPHGERIVFMKARDYLPNELHRDLWLIDADGSDSTQLTDTWPLLANDAHPTWSPDGSKIAFGRYLVDDPHSSNGVWIVPAAGGTPVRLTYAASDVHASSTAQAYPAWSPDGESIAYPYAYWDPYPNPVLEIRVIDAAGGAPTTVLGVTKPAIDLDWQPLGQLTLGPARMVIRDWRGESEHEFRRDPPVVTRYGRTAVPVHLRTGVPGEAVTFRAAPEGAAAGGGYGFSIDPETVGPIVYATTMDANGEIDLYFVVQNLHAEAVEGEPLPTAFHVIATAGAGLPQEATVEVVDNRDRIFLTYSVAQEYVPDGLRSVWRDAFLPPLRGPIADLAGGILGAIVQPGNVLTGSIHCNTYQSRTLTFLNDVRHSDDGWLMNGLDYAPLQTTHTEHHFIALYPSAEAWAFPRTRILDPWLAQTVAVYTWQEFVNFVDPAGQGSHIVPDMQQDENNPGTCAVQCGAGVYLPPPYPALGGRYPYFAENAGLRPDLRFNGCLMVPHDWCTRNGYAEPVHRNRPGVTDHATIVTGSPVGFYVELPDQRGFGFEPPDLFVNDFADEFSAAALAYPEPGGAQGWYVEVPPGRAFTLDTTAVEDDTMSVAVLATGGVVWGVYRDVPVTAGATMRLDVDLDRPCAPLALASGDAVACERPPTVCASDAACRDADPCTDDRCTDVLCAYTERVGVAGARCLCERPAPAQCAGQPVPAVLDRKHDAACKALGKAETVTGRKGRRLLGKATRQWKAAQKLLGRRKVKGVLSAGCMRALKTTFGEAMQRTNAARH